MVFSIVLKLCYFRPLNAEKDINKKYDRKKKKSKYEYGFGENREEKLILSRYK